MREIKFKAWDRKEKKMLPDVGFLDSDGGRTIITRASMSGGHEYFDMNDLWQNDFRFILMQFTGLKDCNGKEIYEGDIIEIEDDLNVRGIVRYDEESAMFMEDEFSLFEILNAGCSIKVIGNIYENPELRREGG